MTLQERFDRHVIRGPECWMWDGDTNPRGYAFIRISPDRGHYAAHRVSYELFVGPIPEGLEIDHLCRNTGCVRPDHLEPVTHIENVRRWSRTITECLRGHPYDERNTRHTPVGRRTCRACERERSQRRRDEAKAL